MKTSDGSPHVVRTDCYTEDLSALSYVFFLELANPMISQSTDGSNDAVCIKEDLFGQALVINLP
jgi:hypothetical protein